MGLAEAEYYFKSAQTYGAASIEATDAYLPAGAFHKAMADGMLELTRALKEMSARLDTLASTTPTRPVPGGPLPDVVVSEPTPPTPRGTGHVRGGAGRIPDAPELHLRGGDPQD